MTHTPLPWQIKVSRRNVVRIVGPSKSLVNPPHPIATMASYGEEAKANAALITRACNSHAQLLEALVKARQYVAVDAPRSPLVQLIDAAIKAAGG